MKRRADQSLPQGMIRRSGRVLNKNKMMDITNTIHMKSLHKSHSTPSYNRYRIKTQDYDTNEFNPTPFNHLKYHIISKQSYHPYDIIPKQMSYNTHHYNNNIPNKQSSYDISKCENNYNKNDPYIWEEENSCDSNINMSYYDTKHDTNMNISQCDSIPKPPSHNRNSSDPIINNPKIHDTISEQPLEKSSIPSSPQPSIDIHNDPTNPYHYICSPTVCLHHIDRQVIISTIACMLQNLCDINQKHITAWLNKYGFITTPSIYVTLFHGIQIPDISIYHYLSRIGEITHCSSAIFVFLYIYILRYHYSHIQKKHGYMGVSPDTSPDYPWECNAINHLTIHRLIITCMLLATKFHEDECATNSFFAMMGGITLTEINKLEFFLFQSLSFQLHVSHSLFFMYYRDIHYHSNQYYFPTKHINCKWKCEIGMDEDHQMISNTGGS